MKNTSPKPPRLRFRLLLGKTVMIGPGKADLLEAIAATGSISAACRSMGMSYKKAWYLIETMNGQFATPLVEASKGGSARGGARLTPLGEDVLARYRAIEAKAADAVSADLEAFNALVTESPEAG
jgi:molybdate transport system regulatory protein